MITWLENYGKTHLFYIILIAVGLFSFHAWQQEHDARLLAEQTVKQTDAQVKTLQQQIVTNNTQAAAKVQVVTKIVHDAVTPAQQIAAVPQLSDVQLNAREIPSLAPDGPPEVAVDLAPLVMELGQCRQDSINLGACTQNYNACQDIVKARDGEIVVLKKKPNFFHRVVGVAKAVGVGIGIGLLLGAKV
jgi:hypothetical protein